MVELDQTRTGGYLNRRSIVKAMMAAAAAAIWLPRASRGATSPSADAVAPTGPMLKPDRFEPVHLVRPLIGTGWHGHTFPGATVPFGLVQLSPDTLGPPEPKWNTRWDIYHWDHCSGYHYPDNIIKGFSHTHLSGTGAKDLGDVLLMPIVEGANWAWHAQAPGKQHEDQLQALGPNSGWVPRDKAHGYCSWFSHRQEVARPGYYSVDLQTPGVKAELTATCRCGMHRYDYSAVPPAARRGVILDLVHGLGCAVYHADLKVESDTRITGSRFTHGWAPNRQVYFVIEFSQPFTQVQVQVDGKIQTAKPGDSLSGKHIRAMFTSSPANSSLMMRVGISATGVHGAEKNLAAEIPHWHFDAIKRKAQQAWSSALAALDAHFSDQAHAETFYTAAYHNMVAPATFNDVDGTYRGEDRKNHPNPGFTNYTTMSIWDIYRGEFPLMMLAQPHRTNDVIKTLLADYQQLQQHSLPVWPLWGNETWCMTGFHVVGMIAGAYVRGFRNYDVAAVYQAMRDTALVGATTNDNKELQRQFRHFGYVPTGPGRQSVSRTLDFAYDYWCVGAMAQLLGHHADAEMFYKLGQNYKNLFDPASGFMRGKTESGKWRQPFRPNEEYWSDYTESDAWQASFNVMQDVQGLIDLYGGDAPFIARLDAFFRAPSKTYRTSPDVSGMVGQDAQGNEPSNHIPYLYPFAGAAWKTQYWIRKVLALYNNTPNGIPGNDDCGQISSCFTLGALGFYPVNAVTGVYIIGSPLIRRAKIRNPLTGKVFTIVAENNSQANMFIQKAALNGKELTRSWFTNADILAGGELRFHMGPKPNKEWAAAKADRPPSGLIV